MTFAASEASLVAGAPYELHEFRLGETATYWRYADAPVDIVYAGNTYTACYCPGDRIEAGANAMKSATKVKMDWQNPFAWQYRAGPPEEIVHYVRYKGHGADVQAIFRGDVTQVVFRQTDRKGTRYAEVSIDPYTTAMQRPGLITQFQRQCGVALYSTPCGVLRATCKTSGTLDSVTGNVLTSTTFGTQADGYWLAGDIVVNGCRRWIIEHSGNDIRIVPGIGGLAAGQAFDVYPGCNHLPGAAGDCNAKFSNLANYRGQPNIPDKDPGSTWGIL